MSSMTTESSDEYLSSCMFTIVVQQSYVGSYTCWIGNFLTFCPGCERVESEKCYFWIWVQGYDNHSYMASNLLTNIYFFIVAIFPHTRNWDGGCHFVECILFFLIVLITTHVMSLEKKWEPWPAENPIPKLLELHV